jgi:flagellar basal-body rod modification protein FlgD
MAIDPAALQALAPPPEAREKASPNTKLGKDEFVKLLVTQLSNQDPTKPLDSQEFVAQLAQFSSLEQHQGTNERLDSLLLAQASASQTSATTFVGKQILYKSDRLSLTGTDPVTVPGKLGAAAESLNVTILGPQGQAVRTMRLGKHAAGSFDVTWDGRDDAGNTLPPGDYRARITAADASGKGVGVEMRGTGLVTGVVFENGYPELMVAGSRIKMSDIVELRQL